jgi:hypothetical protein
MADAALKAGFKKISPHLPGEIQSGQVVNIDTSHMKFETYLMLHPEVVQYSMDNDNSLSKTTCTIYLYDKNNYVIGTKYNCYAKDGDIMVSRAKNKPMIKKKSYFRFSFGLF